jgi:hypothetical protein
MLLDFNVSLLPVTGILCMLVCITVKLFETSPVPKDLPWVLKKQGLLQRALERFIGTNPISFIQEGYEKVCLVLSCDATCHHVPERLQG